MRPCLSALVLSAALVGCHTQSVPTPPPAATPPRSTQDVEAAIGWGAIALPGDPDVDKLVDAKDYAAALETAPSRTDVRVALAQELARDGHRDEAWNHLRRALAEDLPQVRAIALGDASFEVVRQEHPELRDLIKSLDQRYAQTLERGVPAFVYRTREPWPDGYSQDPQTPYTELRAGVYVPTDDRFVPMVPAVEGAFLTAFDVVGKRALVISGELMVAMWLASLGRLDAHVYPLEPPFGVPLFEAEDMLDGPELSYSVSVHLDPDELALWVERQEVSQIDYFERIDQDGVHEAGLETSNGSTEEVTVSKDFHSGPPSISFSLRNGPDDSNYVYASHRRPTPEVPAKVKERLSGASVIATARGDRTGDGVIVVETEAGLRRYRPPDYKPEPAMAGVHLDVPDLPVGEGGV